MKWWEWITSLNWTISFLKVPNVPWHEEVIAEVRDQDDTFLGVHENFYENIVSGSFARLAGKSLGIVANQPTFFSCRCLRYSFFGSKGCPIRLGFLAISFNIPLLVFEDVPGLFQGTDQNGIPSFPTAQSCSMPLLKQLFTVHRHYPKSLWRAYDVMNSKHIGADMNYTGPLPKSRCDGSKRSCWNHFKKEISESKDPGEIEEKWLYQTFRQPYRAARKRALTNHHTWQNSEESWFVLFKMLQRIGVKLPRKKRKDMPFVRKYAE